MATRARDGWLSSLWAALAGSLLRPVPAAIYLVAVAAVIGIAVPPGGEPEVTYPLPGGVLTGGVVLLADESQGLRATGQVPHQVPVVAGENVQFLLLEFTNLERPLVRERCSVFG